jgi:Ca2+-binding EF-hand superfamily protein
LLRLFANQQDEVRLEELSEAVSVSPLGISRAEVQSVFAHLAGGGSETLPLSTLIAAVETAYNTGMPSEAAVLEGINLARLAAALQRLDGKGRANIQEFRVTVMQAEPYLTAHQLEWMMALTDKDGEGRLLPRTLLVRLGAGQANPNRAGSLMVPPRPVSSSSGLIAPRMPRSQVVAALLARIRDRLFAAGPQLTLERVFSIFEIGTDRGISMSRETLACLLGHMRLGISVREADELVSSIATSGNSSVHLHSLYEAVLRAGEPDQEAIVDEFRDFVRERFVGRGSQFAESALRAGGPRADGGDWLQDSEFRWCLAHALADEGIQATRLDPEEEDKVLLLVEKSAAGTVRWRHFASTYLGWHDDDYHSDCGQGSPKRGQPVPSSTQQTFHQTWRSAKNGAPERTVVVASPEKAQGYGQMKEPSGMPVKISSTDSPSRQGGPCRCLARLFLGGGGGKDM